MYNNYRSMNALRKIIRIQHKYGYKFSKLDLPPRQVMQYDVLIVGGGVAGLSTAIKLKQKEKQIDRAISVCLIEKGSEIGDHILSGNCFQPRGLDQLFPGWRTMTENRPPIDTPVTHDEFYFMINQNKQIKIPNILLPNSINNHGNYVISLGKLSKWMSDRATEMGVDIFTGTPGAEVLYGADGAVEGVATGDFGISKGLTLKPNFQRGIEIRAKQTVFAEGCRGSLSEKVIEKFNLRKQCDPQLYGIGLKQVWEVDNQHFNAGLVQHSVGWPLPSDTYAGTFMYHMKPNQIHIGLVVGLNYQNPHINPYEQFQKMKTHPQFKKYLQGGQCISYGARALNSNGYFSIPKLSFEGGVLVGCSAGFMNVVKIKGSHTAIKSGIEAGNAIYHKITDPPQAFSDPKVVDKYETNMKLSWVWDQLYASRNFKNSFINLYTGLLYGGIYKFLHGKEPFNIRQTTKDSAKIQKSINYTPINYPKHDRKLTFDLLDNLSRSGTNHQHDQPSHLVIKQGKEGVPLRSLRQYSGIQQKFCPAKVYEFVEDSDGKRKLQINAQNCLHCKTCSIKMVDEYIEWRTPEGNGGPKYNGM